MRALVEVDAPREPRGVVLMLHGGAQRNLTEVTRRSGSLWRMRLLYDQVHRRLNRAGLATALLRFDVVGWNDASAPSPVPDARWAIEELTRRHPGLPIALLGHSMGARTALAVADSPGVAGVVGLAPWFPDGEDVRPLAGRRLIAAHGSRDRITSAAHSRRLVARAAPIAASAQFVDAGPVGHYMLRQVAHWNRIAERGVLEIFPSGA